jgi:hypothetical protein
LNKDKNPNRITVGVFFFLRYNKRRKGSLLKQGGVMEKEKGTELPDKEFCDICKEEIINHMTHDGGERV